jgi:hypothetical protein
MLSKPKQTRVGCARFADPLDAKVNSVLFKGQTDDLVEVESGLDTAQLDPLLANVDRNRFLGENLALAVHPEDAHWHLDLFARLVAPTHAVAPVVQGKS